MIRDRVPLLAKAVPFVGDRQIRNRGTLGGALCHADPAGEMPLCAVTLGARLHIVGPARPPRARRRGVLPGAVHDGPRADRDAGGGGVSRRRRAPRPSSSSTRGATATSPSSASPPPACPRPTGAGAGSASGSAPSPIARATRGARPRGSPARASSRRTSRRRPRAAWRRPSRPRTSARPPSTGGTSSRSSWSARSTSWRGGGDERARDGRRSA